MNILTFIFFIATILAFKKVETFMSFNVTQTKPDYNDLLCDLRKKSCSTIVGVNERFKNMNPGNLKPKTFKNF